MGPPADWQGNPGTGSAGEEDVLGAELAAEADQGKLFRSRQRSEAFTRCTAQLLQLASVPRRILHASLPRCPCDPPHPAAVRLHARWHTLTRSACSGDSLERAEQRLRHFGFQAFEGGSGQPRWGHQVRSPHSNTHIQGSPGAGSANTHGRHRARDAQQALSTIVQNEDLSACRARTLSGMQGSWQSS